LVIQKDSLRLENATLRLLKAVNDSYTAHTIAALGMSSAFMFEVILIG
jgi:hypothetical protein